MTKFPLFLEHVYFLRSVQGFKGNKTDKGNQVILSWITLIKPESHHNWDKKLLHGPNCDNKDFYGYLKAVSSVFFFRDLKYIIPKLQLAVVCHQDANWKWLFLDEV